MFRFEVKTGVGKSLILPMLATAIIGVTCCKAAELPEKLSLADAVSIALTGNAEIKRAEADTENAFSSVRVEGIQMTYGVGGVTNMERDPEDSGMSSRVFGSVSYENLAGTTASVEVAPLGIGSERGSIGLTIKKPLLRGKGLLSQKSNALIGARSDATVQEKELYLLKQAKVQDVAEAYYRSVLAREQIKVRERALAVAEEAATGARKREEAGLVAEIEVSRAEIRVAETKNSLNIQQQSARTALDRLMVTIGQGVGKTPELTDIVPETEVRMPPLADAIKTALANRSELSVYDERISDQERRLAMTEDELKPEFNAVAGFNSINKDKGFISTSLYDWGSLLLGVEMRLPLDKRITMENRAVASRGVDTLQKMRVYQMEEIARQVREAYRSVESAGNTVEIFSQNMKVAEDRLSIAQRMVDEGLETNREVLDAQESLTQLENSLLAARVDLYLAGINLKYAMGEDITALWVR